MSRACWGPAIRLGSRYLRHFATHEGGAVWPGVLMLAAGAVLFAVREAPSERRALLGAQRHPCVRSVFVQAVFKTVCSLHLVVIRSPLVAHSWPTHLSASKTPVSRVLGSYSYARFYWKRMEGGTT